jgi:hypothetical protein
MSAVQAVLFPLEIWTARAAEAWLSRHGFIPIKKSIEGHFYHYRLRRPSLFDHFATKVVFHTLKNRPMEIHLIVGYREPQFFE